MTPKHPLSHVKGDRVQSDQLGSSFCRSALAVHSQPRGAAAGASAPGQGGRTLLPSLNLHNYDRKASMLQMVYNCAYVVTNTLLLL